MADWSILITLFIYSVPLIDSWAPGFIAAPLKRLASVLYNTSQIRVLLPEPDTPVIAVNLRRGTSTEIFFKLLWVAFFILILSCGKRTLRLSFGTAIFSSPRKYLRVKESEAPFIFELAFKISDIGPSVTIFPP